MKTQQEAVLTFVDKDLVAVVRRDSNGRQVIYMCREADQDDIMSLYNDGNNTDNK